ncbi:MAG: hypothetical protein RLZZ511_3546 [Cyanobacteriota bacterium]|jgi:hypothetical protein
MVQGGGNMRRCTDENLGSPCNNHPKSFIDESINFYSFQTRQRQLMGFFMG